MKNIYIYKNKPIISIYVYLLLFKHIYLAYLSRGSCASARESEAPSEDELEALEKAKVRDRKRAGVGSQVGTR